MIKLDLLLLLHLRAFVLCFNFFAIIMLLFNFGRFMLVWCPCFMLVWCPFSFIFLSFLSNHMGNGKCFNSPKQPDNSPDRKYNGGGAGSANASSYSNKLIVFFIFILHQVGNEGLFWFYYFNNVYFKSELFVSNSLPKIV